jgi:hypothetical protein
MSTVGRTEVPTLLATETMNKNELLLLEINPTEDGEISDIFFYQGNRDAVGTRKPDVYLGLFDSSGNLLTYRPSTSQSLPRGTYYWRQHLDYYPWLGPGTRTFTGGNTYYLGAWLTGYYYNNINYSAEGILDRDYSGSSGIITGYSHGGNFTPASIVPETYDFVLYTVYTATGPTGPSLKIEGITPDKLENTSWSDISDVR